MFQYAPADPQAIPTIAQHKTQRENYEWMAPDDAKAGNTAKAELA